MAAETWFDADKAVELGFADSVSSASGTTSATNSARCGWDLSAFAHTPAAAHEPQPAPAVPAAPVTPAAPAASAAPIVDREALIRATRVATLSA